MSLTMLVEGGQASGGWEIEEAIDRFLRPFARALSPVYDIYFDSQVPPPLLNHISPPVPFYHRLRPHSCHSHTPQAFAAHHCGLTFWANLLHRLFSQILHHATLAVPPLWSEYLDSHVLPSSTLNDFINSKVSPSLKRFHAPSLSLSYDYSCFYAR